MVRLHAAELNRSKVALWMLCGLAAPALAASDGGVGMPRLDAMQRTAPTSGTAAQLLDFDIPAQPLVTALNRYAALSGQPALFLSELVAGRTSSAVRGRYLPEAALRLLLEGTGLVADKVDTGLGDTFVLTQAATPDAASRSGIVGLFRDDDYPGLVQTRIWQTLCANARTAPGAYRSLLRFQVDAMGRLYGARLLGSTGDAVRDAELLETLQHLRIERSPPPTIVQQPLTMIVLPSKPGSGPHCSKEAS